MEREREHLNIIEILNNHTRIKQKTIHELNSRGKTGRQDQN